MGRVISYGEKTGYNDGDYFLLDNGSGGTKRIRADRVGVRLDPTLTDPNKAASINTQANAIIFNLTNNTMYHAFKRNGTWGKIS